MKKFLLIIAAILTGAASPVAASTDDKVALRNAFNFGNSFIFVENGITFSVYPDGEFDFYINDRVNVNAHVGVGPIGVTFNSGYNYNPYVQYDDYGAIIQVENYLEATSQLSQTTLRSVLGQHELDDMLAERDRLNADVQTILDKQTEAWGVKVANVEIKHVDLNESMIRAIAKQAEAERERRAKVIHAMGEAEAAEKLAEAAKILATEESAIQLRYLQTLVEIAGDKSSTIVFPLPVDIMKKFTS